MVAIFTCISNYLAALHTIYVHIHYWLSSRWVNLTQSQLIVYVWSYGLPSIMWLMQTLITTIANFYQSLFNGPCTSYSYYVNQHLLNIIVPWSKNDGWCILLFWIVFKNHYYSCTGPTGKSILISPMNAQLDAPNHVNKWLDHGTGINIFNNGQKLRNCRPLPLRKII